MSDRAFRRPPTIEPREVPDDAVLTQYGRLDPALPTFRGAPRFPDESELSMLWGHLGQRDAARLVRRGYEPDDRDVARYCTAGALRAVGFVVDNTPTRWNPEHVSVSVPGGASAWDDLQKALFAHVFAWHDEGGT